MKYMQIVRYVVFLSINYIFTSVFTYSGTDEQEAEFAFPGCSVE